VAVKVTVYGEAKLEQLERARAEIQRLEDQVRRNAAGFSGAMTRMGESMQATGAQISAAGSSLTRNLTVPVIAAAGGLAFLAKGAEDAAIAQAKLENVLDGMGFGEHSARVNEYAEELERTLAVDADLIKATQTKLATFRELTASVGEAGGAFDRATLAAIDLAAAGFGSAESNAVALGKALNDPIKGITALTRSGVTFTEAERNKIAALVESNQTLAAQELILKAIETQVGGTAEAGASSFERIRLQLAAIGDELGAAALPLIERFADLLTNVIAPAVIPVLEKIAAKFRDMSPGMQTAILALGAVAAAAGPVLLVIGGMTSSIGKLLVFLPKMGGGLLGVLGPIGLIIGALAALVASSPELQTLLGATLTDLMTQLSPVLQQVVAAFQPLVGILGGALSQVVTALAPVVGTLIGALADVLMLLVPILADLLAGLAPVIEILAGVFSQVLAAIIPIIVALLDALMPVVMMIAETFVGALNTLMGSGLIDTLIGLFMQIVDAVMPLLPLLMELVTPLLDLLAPIGELIGSFLPPLVDFLGVAIPFAVDVVVTILEVLIGIIVAVVTAIVRFVVDGVKNIARFATDVAANIGKAIDWFVNLPNEIGKALAGAARWLVNTGRDIITGLLQGIKNAWDSVTKWIGDAIAGLVNGIKALLGIASPSRVFASIGEQMGDGLRVGLESTITAVERAARGVAAAAVITAAGTVALGLETGAQGFSGATGGLPVASPAAAGTTIQLAPGAIQVTIQGDASRDDVRGGVEDALASLLTQVRAR